MHLCCTYEPHHTCTHTRAHTHVHTHTCTHTHTHTVQVGKQYCRGTWNSSQLVTIYQWKRVRSFMDRQPLSSNPLSQFISGRGYVASWIGNHCHPTHCHSLSVEEGSSFMDRQPLSSNPMSQFITGRGCIASWTGNQSTAIMCL